MHHLHIYWHLSADVTLAASFLCHLLVALRGCVRDAPRAPLRAGPSARPDAELRECCHHLPSFCFRRPGAQGEDGWGHGRPAQPASFTPALGKHQRETVKELPSGVAKRWTQRGSGQAGFPRRPWWLATLLLTPVSCPCHRSGRPGSSCFCRHLFVPPVLG